MSPKERRTKMFDYLKSADDWITVSHLAEHFNVSERTLHNDLSKLENVLKYSHWKIEKKRGVGIRVNVTSIEKSENSEVGLATDDRKINILSKLLLDFDKVTFEGLSQSSYVSVTSIRNDIEVIKQWLHKNTEVKILSDRFGTKIEGNEEAIREAIVWFNQHIIENRTKLEQSNLNQLKVILKEFYNHTIIDVAYDILFDFIKKNNHLLSDYYILNTLNIYLVQLHRLSHGHTLTKKGNFLESIAFSYEIVTMDDYTASSKELLSRAASRLSFAYSENEINYLTKHLILNRLENIPLDAQNEQLIEELIRHLSATVSVNLNNDERLKRELEQHIPPMLYRLKLNINSDNPFANQVKNEFGETFYTIKLAVERFEKRLNITFNDEELALLTIYFQSAIERKNLNQQILVVCQHGLAMSGLLVNRLEKIIPSRVTINTASVGELDYFKLTDFDLVVSTVDSLAGENVINVSDFLNDRDVKRILDRLSIIENEKRKPSDISHHLEAVLKPEYIVIGANFENREELLSQTVDRLSKDGYATKEYLKSILLRETKGNTDFLNGVAIPHGASDYVKRSIVVIITNTKKIHWNKFYVDKVFIPLISQEDMQSVKAIIKDIYNIIDDRETIENLPAYLEKIKGRLEQ